MTEELNPTSEAVEAILRTMQMAESGQHTPGSWTKEGALHHLLHADNHLDSVLWVEDPESALSADNWLDIDHALTRLAMAVWCHQRGDDGDHGAEGNGR